MAQKAWKKFEEDKELIQSINAAGGLGTMKGLQIAGGYDSFEEIDYHLNTNEIKKIYMKLIKILFFERIVKALNLFP